MHKKNTGMIVAFITPALLIFLMIFIYPIIRTIIMSFYYVESVTAPTSD
ncbi:MAG: sugar ABC transporter permease, partial [Christensenellaceae bacterium]|nr:sugar ABC transporter permease [Christensenellaceae bacterium]